jgi:hypothetical protein
MSESKILSTSEKSEVNLLKIAEDQELLEIGRKAIEDALIEFRDDRLSTPMRGNGLVIREKDGKDSSIIRMGPEMALSIGLKAIHQKLTVLDESVRSPVAESFECQCGEKFTNWTVAETHGLSCKGTK